MKRLLTATLMLVAMGFAHKSEAQVFSTTTQTQSGYYDVFVPIAKYMAVGDIESLSAWFADNLEITILNSTNNSSKNQARQILKSFFNSFSPMDFQIVHNAGSGNMKYAIGSLNAGGENFMVTIFVSNKSNDYKIQQLKIERIE